MIEYILFISILLFIYYDLRYVKSFPLIALIIAIQTLMLGNHIVWLITFFTVALVYELFSLFRSKILEYDDYIHLANSITLLPEHSLLSLTIYLISYIVLIVITTMFYKNIIPTAAQTYISSSIVLLFYHFLI